MSGHDRLLKTRQVADAFRVSGSTIKRWVDSGDLVASRTVGRHRLIPLSEALRFGRRQGLPVRELEQLGADGAGVRTVEVVDEGLVNRLIDALNRADSGTVEAIVESVASAPFGAARLSDQLIRPVMERVGHAWADGSIEVFQEHQASQMIASALTGLNRNAGRVTSADAPLALGATPQGDPYQLALMLGELVLRQAGWDVRNLGVNLPMRSLGKAVSRYRPGLVFLSVSHLEDQKEFIKTYREFYEVARAHDVAVVLGGRALGPDLREKLDYASFGDRMAHLAELARRLAALGRRGDSPGSIHGPPGPENPFMKG